jgi:Lhr-like helicase
MSLVKTPHKYGYRKVTPEGYKEVKRKLGTPPPVGKFSLDDISYRYVHEHNNPIWISDHENHEDIPSFNPQTLGTPQEQGIEISRRFRMERLLGKYEDANKKLKKKMLGRAIRFFTKKGMNKELLLANTLLNKLR